MRRMSTVMTKEFPDCFTLSNLIKDPKSCVSKPQICTVQKSSCFHITELEEVCRTGENILV